MKLRFGMSAERAAVELAPTAPKLNLRLRTPHTAPFACDRRQASAMGPVAAMATVVSGDFEWEEEKAASNLVKHGVTFEEAATVFSDPWYILKADEGHPERFHAIGFSGLARLLTVVHVERGEKMRIISARKATAFEEKTYERRRPGP